MGSQYLRKEQHMAQQAGNPGTQAGDTTAMAARSAPLLPATLVGPQDGRIIPFGSRPLRVLVEPQATDGSFALFESAPTPGGPVPPAHRHFVFTEAFYVLEGIMEFYVDGDTLRVPAGSLVHIPRGAVHTFANPGPAAARMLAMVTPARALALVESNGALLAGGPPDIEQLRALYAQHQTELIDRR
jgi:quercetin dioxygenase-like cupin family protein